ncbi:hypothetical protein [Arenibacterium halophilum]|uniref:Uncharacterized protein n=1 Tax=Arenibacterium halophilum TaxID=2583821 RepID=A0ABY2XEL5_9RHOB|nr:hypothetical protein [Arenibacterium halophilum]TMV15471.1 hypothetical protein FGK64_05835 [Arenibacterium halophilum]
MPDVDIILYFTPPDGNYVEASVLIEDAALRARLNVAEDCVGGIAIEGPGGPIFIEDDFDHVVRVLLDQAPDEIEAGKSVRFDYHYEETWIDIEVSDGTATFLGEGGKRVAMPAAEAATALRAARDELTRLNALL